MATLNYSDAGNIISLGFAAGLEVGYQHPITDNMGFRYYLDYFYSRTSASKTMSVQGNNADVNIDINSHMAFANIDYYYNFTDNFAFSIGLGLGYHTMRPYLSANVTGTDGVSRTNNFNDKYGGSFALPINIGFSYDFLSSHRLTLSAKIPTLFLEYNSAQLGYIDIRSFIVSVGHSLVF
ncbi:outer membrane beta-barrel protein [Helicobacter saguini]|nr:outer membrane beta-barrel protein [Helicobacter saguini]MWV70442.1 outer membrane beta-barrel protein [Helicobacter saguini]